MNKNIYRIVFNKLRGQWMAVAEYAKAQGKGTGGKTAAAASVEAGAVLKTLLARVRPLCLSVFAALGMVTFFAGVAGAQVVTDRNAPANQRPTVLVTGNSIPLVNIQTPSSAGVSRNTYSQLRPPVRRCWNSAGLKLLTGFDGRVVHGSGQGVM
jgi:filamentous hemagglutinin